MIYFDYAASCPLDEDAAQIYVKAATQYYGNSQSLHDIGSQASDLLESCRSKFARMLGVIKEGIYFTGGGSEGNFLSIHALLSSPLKKGRHIITGMAEHSSVHICLESLRADGYEVTALPLNPAGQIDIELVKATIREDTVLMSIQHGNPEIGTLQPIQEISELCKANDILIHTDCVQTFGKVDVRPIAGLVDSLTISGHKFYGPKGIGVIFLNPRLHWLPFLPGTAHENGLRAGTVNVPAIVAMTSAAQKVYNHLDSQMNHYWELRKAFILALQPEHSKCIIYETAKDSCQMPSTIGMRVKGMEGQFLMLECNRHGFAISTGSACQVGLKSPSKTMIALGLKGKIAKEFIRISFGRETTEEDVKALGQAIVKIINE